MAFDTREHEIRSAKIVDERVTRRSHGKLYLSTTDKMIGGVLGGIAERFHYNPVTVRILFALFTIVTFIWPGVLLYLILWIIIPRRPTRIDVGVDTQ